MAELLVGTVKDYYAKIGVAAVELSGELAVGDTVRIHGHTTDFTQEVTSIQIEKEAVPKGAGGQTVGIKVKEKVRDHDRVYKVVP